MFRRVLITMVALAALATTARAMDFTYVDDHQALQTLNTLADRLTQSTRIRVPYHIGILNYPELNAFCNSEGQIFVTRKLLQSVGSEEEIAAVLAHELAHLSRRFSSPIVRSFSAMDGDEFQADQVGLKMLNRAQINSGSLLMVLSRVTTAWGDNIPKSQRKILEKRMKNIAKKAHLNYKDFVTA
ncbi:MAG: M48 family metallopeptidase [Acidobacteriia bacterium]|nr:M48 family metallopeptidase [Terriglobia bacterium]